MKTLNKILTGIALTGALAFGYNANAQIVPTKVATETAIVSNNDVSGIPLQRTEIGNDYFTLKYDINFKMTPQAKPVNVGLFALNNLYSRNDTINKKSMSVGAETFQVGKFDGKDTWFVDSWIAGKNKDISYMFDAGLGFPAQGPLQTYVISSLKHPKASASAAFYEVTPEDIRYYGYGAYHDNNIYAAVGNNINTEFASAGIYGKEDFGNLTFATYDRESGNVWIKSQTAFLNANKKFFSIETFDMASDILALPAFQPVHLNPISTKGNIALKLEYKKKGKTQESEVMLATDATPVQIGLGLNTGYSDGKSSSNVAIELYKDFKFKNFTGSIEARYNNRTKDMTGYMKMMYTF